MLFLRSAIAVDGRTHHFIYLVPARPLRQSHFKLFNFNLYFYELKLVQFIINEGSLRFWAKGERFVALKNIDLH